MINMFKHLLPNARAWRLTTQKQLRQFFEGLAPLGDDIKLFFDQVWLDIFPDTTRELEKWEKQFALAPATLTEQERRDRVLAAWRAQGGQDPVYLQETLRANRFDVYVHEWWVPGTEPAPGVKACVTPRNPFTYLRANSKITGFQVTAGNPLATCGNPAATCGSSLEPVGYPLVNKIFKTVPEYFATCGNPAATCGNPAATCGNYNTLKNTVVGYDLPADSTKWPYFLYIGGETFPALAEVPTSRKDEFEALCLKICPAQQWLGILVKYD